MVKVKAPLFGFGASGDLGKDLSYRRQLGQDVAIKTPTHIDAQTLPQVYQRWRYIDAIFYWKSLSDAQKTIFRAEGSRHHLTGYQECLRQYMRMPFDQVLWLKCDVNTQPTTPDSSKHGNTGTVYGASPATGKIGSCFSFDGINDYLDCGDPSGVNLPLPFTLIAWAKKTTAGVIQYMLRKTHNYGIYVNSDEDLRLSFHDGITYRTAFSGFSFPLNVFTHIAITLAANGANTDVAIYPSGTQYGAIHTLTGHPQISAYDLHIGKVSHALSNIWHGLIDDVRIYSRALSPEHIHYIATQELYPPPG